MDKQKYAFLFLNTHPSHAFLFTEAPSVKCPEKLDDFSVIYNDFEKKSSVVQTEDSFHGKFAAWIPNGEEWIAAQVPIAEKNIGKKIYVSLEWMQKFSFWKNNAAVEVQLVSADGVIYFSQTRIIRPSPRADVWQFGTLSCITKATSNTSDTLWIKIKNPSDPHLVIDDFRMVFGFVNE